VILGVFFSSGVSAIRLIGIGWVALLARARVVVSASALRGFGCETSFSLCSSIFSFVWARQNPASTERTGVGMARGARRCFLLVGFGGRGTKDLTRTQGRGPSGFPYVDL
jgi:hypothetical protein